MISLPSTGSKLLFFFIPSTSVVVGNCHLELSSVHVGQFLLWSVEHYLVLILKEHD